MADKECYGNEYIIEQMLQKNCLNRKNIGTAAYILLKEALMGYAQGLSPDELKIKFYSYSGENRPSKLLEFTNYVMDKATDTSKSILEKPECMIKIIGFQIGKELREWQDTIAEIINKSIRRY